MAEHKYSINDAMSEANEIKFYTTKDKYGFLSNLYRAPIQLKGKTWMASECYYQAQKFAGSALEEEVRKAPNPKAAIAIGRDRGRPLRADWEEVKDQIMYEVVLAKFTQNPELKQKLLDTGEALLIEHSTADSYWADAGDGTGKNMLGKILMKVREELRRSH